MGKINRDKRVKILSLLLSLFVMSGCDKMSFTKDDATIKIPVSECATYTAIESGDVLIKDDENTVVIIKDVDGGTKEVCVVSGSATLYR